MGRDLHEERRRNDKDDWHPSAIASRNAWGKANTAAAVDYRNKKAKARRTYRDRIRLRKFTIRRGAHGSAKNNPSG